MGQVRECSAQSVHDKRLCLRFVVLVNSSHPCLIWDLDEGDICPILE